MSERKIFNMQHATAEKLREVAARQYQEFKLNEATFSPYGPFHMQNQLAHRGEPNLHVRDCVFLSSKEDIDDWQITQEIKLTVLTCQVQDISDIKRKLYRLGEDIAKFKSQRSLLPSPQPAPQSEDSAARW